LSGSLGMYLVIPIMRNFTGFRYFTVNTKKQRVRPCASVISSPERIGLKIQRVNLNLQIYEKVR
jgi:hypothetical protein